MSRSNERREGRPNGGAPWGTPPWPERAKRWATVVGIALAGLLILAWIVKATCFHYVGPNEMLVVVSKTGDPPKAGRILVEPGEKGIQKDVLGEGWHFVTPILNEVRLEKNIVLEPGEVGIVTNLGGDQPKESRILVDSTDVKGVQRQILLPGAYRINPYGYKVQTARAVEIKPGFVGVVRRKLEGSEDVGATLFGEDGRTKGILPKPILQPGMYYVNNKEYEVIPREVGVYQTSYHYDTTPQLNTAISFKVRDGNFISMDCTIEWELQPDDAPKLFALYKTIKNIEKDVVDQQARKIGRNRGFDYKAQEWLDGEKREKYQADFEQQLREACEKHHVHVRSAFIRNIIIPDKFLEAKRKRQLAIETKITKEATAETNLSTSEVEAAKKDVEVEVGKVESETEKIVTLEKQKIDNLLSQNQAEIRKLEAEYEAKLAALEAEQIKVLGKAQADSLTLEETARSNIYKLKMDVFQSDADAFLKYNVAKELNPNMVFRLFHAGPGTFWTNMNGKNTSLLLPTPGSTTPSTTPIGTTPK